MGAATVKQLGVIECSNTRAYSHDSVHYIYSNKAVLTLACLPATCTERYAASSGKLRRHQVFAADANDTRPLAHVHTASNASSPVRKFRDVFAPAAVLVLLVLSESVQSGCNVNSY